MKFVTQARAALLALFCTGIATAGSDGWLTDYEAAKKEAAASGKTLLIDFTGSDWCPLCVVLKNQVFDQDSFKKEAKEKYVLLELDLPRDKSKQSEAEIKQNTELAKKYVVEGFPTVLLADAEGRPFALAEYHSDGPESYIEQLRGFAVKKKTRDDAFAAAEKEQGVAKANALITVLNSLDLHEGLVSNFYGQTIADIKKADPEDASGFSKKMADQERMAKFDEDLGALADKKDFDGAFALIEKTLKEGNLIPEDAQKVTLMKALIFADQGKFDEAIKVVDEAKLIAPNSETAAQFGDLKKQLLSMKAHGPEGE